MLPRAKDYQRAGRQIERSLDQPGIGGDDAIESILTASADLLGIVGACWHLTDPSSGLPVSNSMLGEPAGSLEESLIFEFRRPDVNRFEELRSRRSPVAAISTATRGEVRASARFREMIEPAGSADELRVAFVDAFGLWAALVIFTDRRMSADDLAFMSGLLPQTTARLRSAAAAWSLAVLAPAVEPDEHDGPSVLLLDAGDRIIAADGPARRRLLAVPDSRRVEVPGLISFVSAQARFGADGRSPTARMRTGDGRWFLVNASRLEGARAGDVAVVMQPAPAGSVLDAALRALGLSAREREVTALALQGLSVKAIASELVISPWTVQDHLKAIYEKSGVRSRSELVALVPGGTALS
ncbi:MAG TPA: LuxR C-terminal-related transcriptional regulator [Solirubrobacteraceae bacterium]|nr:LuxR C-terminal-related transcriptional regulator [Solirubrobacteraceae bacterium]